MSAIRSAIDRSCAALGRAAETQRLREGHETLSRRERQVMALIVLGRLNKEVGRELGISEITVKAHRGRMIRALFPSS